MTGPVRWWRNPWRRPWVLAAVTGGYLAWSLIPVLVAVLLSTLPDADTLAAIVFVVASATDALDGWLARRRSMVTSFGKLMDPLADKLLITAALVSLVSLYRLDAWVAMVISAREFAVTGLRMLAIEQGRVISASSGASSRRRRRSRWCRR